MQFLRFLKGRNERIYLDHAAATPLRDEVFAAMRPWLLHTGNPSAIHTEGTFARDAIDTARERIARALHVRPGEVTFVSGGTEANNLAIRGYIEALVQSGNTYNDLAIITTKIEHPSILQTVKMLEERGVEVRFVAVDEEGLIDEKALRACLDEKVVLMTFAYVNSEIGVVQDVKRIVRIIKKWNVQQDGKVHVHLDASQAPLWLPCQVDMLGADMMTLDAGKCGGPVGSGALIHKHVVPLTPIFYGGGQEEGLRGGTEHTANIVGLREAIVRAQDGWKERSAATAALRDDMIARLKEEIPEAVLNGSRENRVANNVNISIPGFDSEFAVVVLDRHGIAASTRSACNGADRSGSHVVRALTDDEARAGATIRFTLGDENVKSDIEKTVRMLKEHTDHMRHI